MAPVKTSMIPSLAVMGAVLLLFVAMAARRHAADPVRKSEEAGTTLKQMPELSSVPLNRSAHGPGLSFSLSLKKVCFIGDWDVVEAEMAATDRPKLLLTIESLGQKQLPPAAVRELSMQTLRSGAEITLPIPEPDGLTPMGIFICKDSDATRRCKGKPLASINDLAKKYSMPILAGQRPRAVEGMLDKVYFFAFLVLDQESVHFANKFLQQPSYQQLGSALLPLHSGREALDPVIRQMCAASQTLKSVALEPGGRHLRLVLPKFEPSVCPRKSRAPSQNSAVRTSPFQGEPGDSQGK